MQRHAIPFNEGNPMNKLLFSAPFVGGICASHKVARLKVGTVANGAKCVALIRIVHQKWAKNNIVP